MKLTDVFPDGTSALVSRGTLDLAFRDGVHGAPAALVPGQEYDVEVVLDACAYSWSPGQVLRVSIAGADWPNTIAPPAPVTLTVHAAEVSLPVLDGSHPAPTFGPGAEHTSESAEGIGWSIEDDVLARRTTARTVSVSEYATPYDGRAVEDYRGEVWVDRRTFAQGAHAVTTYDLSWPGSDAERIEIRVRSVMDLAIVDGRVDVTIDTWATRDGVEVSHRRWEEQAITHPASTHRPAVVDQHRSTPDPREDRRAGGVGVPCRGGRLRSHPALAPVGRASRAPASRGCRPRRDPDRSAGWWSPPRSQSSAWSVCRIGASHHGVRQILSRSRMNRPRPRGNSRLRASAEASSPVTGLVKSRRTHTASARDARAHHDLAGQLGRDRAVAVEVGRLVARRRTRRCRSSRG